VERKKILAEVAEVVAAIQVIVLLGLLILVLLFLLVDSRISLRLVDSAAEIWLTYVLVLFLQLELCIRMHNKMSIGKEAFREDIALVLEYFKLEWQDSKVKGFLMLLRMLKHLLLKWFSRVS
jgi:hypothetical protein